jgi:peptidoglycan/LPS O-acetylase OafA/YrhL
MPTYRPFGLFRFALAMMVLLQHGLLMLTAWGQAVFYRLELGAIAVAVFFALSGFIVAEACHSFYAGRPGAFLANRALRVVPTYLVALGLTVLLDALLYRAGRFAPLGGTLHGPPWRARVVLAGVLEIVPGFAPMRVSGEDFSFIPFAWSLRVEFAFYAAAALLCWLIGRSGRLPWRPERAEPVLAGFCVGAAIFVAHRAPGLPTQLVNLPFFGFGVCVFLASRQLGARRFWQLAVTAAACLAAFPFCGERGHPDLAIQVPILGALLGGLFFLARAGGVPPCLRRWDRGCGTLSYPLYIGHGIVLTALYNLWPGRGAVAYGLAVAGALILAVLLHAGVERPLQSVRDRVRGARV